VMAGGEDSTQPIGAHALVLSSHSAGFARLVASLPSGHGASAPRLTVAECYPVLRAAIQFCYVGRVNIPLKCVTGALSSSRLRVFVRLLRCTTASTSLRS
jgi:hypothetical protein